MIELTKRSRSVGERWGVSFQFWNDFLVTQGFVVLALDALA